MITQDVAFAFWLGLLVGFLIGGLWALWPLVRRPRHEVTVLHIYRPSVEVDHPLRPELN